MRKLRSDPAETLSTAPLRIPGLKSLGRFSDRVVPKDMESGMDGKHSRHELSSGLDARPSTRTVCGTPRREPRRTRVRGVLFASGVVGLAALTACGSGGGGAKRNQGGKSAGIDTTSITIAWNSTPDVAYLPMLMAIDAMRKQGYHVSATTLAGAPEAAQALATDRAQFTEDNITGAAGAVKQGAPIKAVGVISANEAVWVVRDSYSDCSQLSGKSVGIFGPAAVSGYTKQMNLYFKKNCPNAHPNLVTIPDSPLRAQAMANGQIDATVLSIGDAEHLIQTTNGKQKFKIVPFNTEFPGLADNYFYASLKTITKHPSVVTTFLADEMKAARQIYDAPSSYSALLSKYLKPDQYTKESADVELHSKLWYTNGGLDKVGISGLTETLSAFALPGTASALTDNGPLNRALAQIGRSSLTKR